MANDTAKTQTTNLLPVQGTFEPLPPYECINLIGPAGTPFYAPVNPNLDGVSITNSTINSSVIGGTTPAAGTFTNVATTTGTITSPPSGPTSIVNQAYVDSVAQGLSFKQPANYKSIGNLTLSGLGTQAGGDWASSLTAGNRILVTDQSTASENGIYVAASGAWSRSTDANTWDELVAAYLFVLSGATWGGSSWVNTNQQGGTLGVTSVTFVQFSNNATYTAGTGLTLAGFQFSITNTGVSAATYGSASAVPVIAVNAQGQITSASNTNIAIGAAAITSGTIDTARISGTYSGITGVGTLTNLTVTNTISGSISGNAATATSATSATTATNLAGGATGSLPYQSGAGATTFLAAGSNGQFLTLSSGVPAWTSVTYGDVSGPASSVDNQIARFDGTTGKIIQTSSPTISDAGAIQNINEINFDTTPTSLSNSTGSLWWNDTVGTLSFRLDSGGYTSQINEQQFVYGKASATITKGQLVYKTGVVGASGVIQFAPSAAGITDGNVLVGVAYENIANNAFGRVVSVGLLEGINTSAYSNNDTLWYDPAGSGAMTATKPSAPNLKAEIGIVINAGSGGSGSMFVKIFPGSQLGGTDQNVQLTAPISDNSLLQYYSTGGYWRNVASSSISVGTATNLAGGTTGSLPYQSTTGTTTFLAAGSDGQVLKLASGVPTWSSDTSGVTITDDTTTNATRYITFSNLTTGNETTLDVSSTKLQFNPSTGILTATSFSGAGTGLTGTASGLSIGGNAATATSATSATSATNATNIGITDDTSTNATMYPVWVTANTGNLPAKVTSSKLSFNPSTGILTATGFAGSGADLTNLDAGDITAGTLSVSRGGTGVGTLTGIVKGNGTSAFSAATAGTDYAKPDTASTWSANQTFNSGTLKLNGATSGTATFNAPAVAGSNTYTLPPTATTLGYINVPPVGTKTSSYTLATADVGKYVQVGASGSITIPDATFAEGDVVSIFNNTSSGVTITCSITTAYIAGTDSDKASVTLATRGVATVLFISSTVCVISGNVS